MTDNTHTDNEELRSIFARHGVYDGKTSLYFQREVDDFVRDVAQYIQANHTPQAAVQGDLLGQGGLLDQAITICKKYHDTEPHSYLEAAEIVSLCQKHFSSPTVPTKSSGELFEQDDFLDWLESNGVQLASLMPGQRVMVLNAQIDIPKLKSAIFAMGATQTTKLQAEASDTGFKEGQRVGQHQAAERLYRHITAIYMFRDGDKKATAIADTNATDLLKDCEKYLNHNAKAYHAYLKSDRYKRFHPAELEREHKIGEDGE